MNLSPVKHEILEALFLQEKPVKAVQLAKEVGKDFPPVMMHLLGLTRMGYAVSPEKGYYVISDEGKKALGLPEVTKKKALEILAQTPWEKGFHFYSGIGKPLNLYANDLLDFCNKFAKVNVDAVEFHMERGDFEAWFTSLGDTELAKKTALLKKKKLTGEELQRSLREAAKMRCTELSKIVGESAAPPA
jgi:hypothetical protein